MKISYLDPSSVLAGEYDKPMSQLTLPGRCILTTLTSNDKASQIADFQPILKAAGLLQAKGLVSQIEDDLIPTDKGKLIRYSLHLGKPGDTEKSLKEIFKIAKEILPPG